jgi:hypothetical protein
MFNLVVASQKMKTKFFLPFLIFFLSDIYICVSQLPAAIQWAKCYGGSNSENAFAVKPTHDGGYILAGTTNSIDTGDVYGFHGGMSDYWVVKTDSAGTLKWQKCLGGTSQDVARDILVTSDGGYVVAGWTQSNDGDVSGNFGSWDYWIIKLDSAGNIQWQKCHGGTGQDQAYSIQQTSDGGYIMTGYANSTDGEVSGGHGVMDYWVLKLDAAGNFQWQKPLGGCCDDRGHSVFQCFDKGYIVAGQTNSNDFDVTGNHGSFDCWIVKLDTVGIIQWEHCFGSSGSEIAWSIIQAKDSGYVFVGEANGFNDGDVSGNHGGDFWLVKLDTAGQLQWQKCLGGSSADKAYCVRQTHDGGYVMAGNSTSNDYDVSSNHGNGDFWIVKTDSAGNLQWQECLGGTRGEIANSIEETSDGGFIVAGGAASYDGDVIGNHGVNQNDFWLVKLAPPVPLSVSENERASFTLAPNPSNEKLFITSSQPIFQLKIFNTLGVLQSAIRNPQSEIDILSLASGIYFIQVLTERGSVVRKFVKL